MTKLYVAAAVDVLRGNGVRMGAYLAIMIDPDTSLMRGGSDHRKDGVAIGN